VYLKNESFLLKTVTERDETSKDECFYLTETRTLTKFFLMALFYLLIKTSRVVHKKVSHFLKFEVFHCDENLECGLLDNDSPIKEATFFPEILPIFEMS
jgi:hypothetical protein